MASGFGLENISKYIKGDIIVLSTGLKLQFAGGIRIVVDGKTVNPGLRLAWNLCMLQDVQMPALLWGMHIPPGLSVLKPERGFCVVVYAQWPTVRWTL
jgi:hypothetical protein